VRAAALAALVLAVAPVTGATSSGLRGLVTRGPTTPVCRVDHPCSEPAAHVKLTFVRSGRSWSVVTGADGRYRIALAPGTYALRVPSAGRFAYDPTKVVVPRGRVAVVNVSIDTGIR
jgi:Carboxypeptidase regulatory-like domain